MPKKPVKKTAKVAKPAKAKPKPAAPAKLAKRTAIAERAAAQFKLGRGKREATADEAAP